MSSKTYKRKNTKSKNKKKDIKTLKKINIKRNNRRSKMRSNIRKIRGGGGSIKWNSATGFDGKGISINDIEMLKDKIINFKIQNQEIIDKINNLQNKKITKDTIIKGVLKAIHTSITSDTNLSLIIYFENKRGYTRSFEVCKKNERCDKNDLSMYEIEGIEDIYNNFNVTNNLLSDVDMNMFTMPNDE